MEMRQIRTLVKADHKLGGNQFVLGRISGAMAAMCKEEPTSLEFGIGACDQGAILTTETTDAKYKNFTNAIENWFPGLCVFDYVE